MGLVSGFLMDVKPFAVHDGPGIRTTLFLKGCPLKCVWCHNPEGISRTPQLAFYAHKCVHCGECAAVCPRGAHRMREGRHEFFPEPCNACGACERVCPGGALRLFGRKISVGQAVEILLKDRLFYEESGGGVTLSGGEPLLQSAFCREVLAEMKKEGIHTAVDTCGFVRWEAFEQVLPVTDLFLYDLKHTDSAQHRKLTGQGNELILENLRKLSGRKARIEVRIPLVPGCNDSPENVRRTGELLENLSVEKVRLLRCHSLARSKYAALGMSDTIPVLEAMPEDRLREIIGTLRGYGVNAVSDSLPGISENSPIVSCGS